MDILHLTLKKEYFDQIKRGDKKIEYREIKPYWIKRFYNSDMTFKNYDQIVFKNGYSKNAPKMIVEFIGFEVQKGITTPLGKGDFFALKLGKVLEA